MRQLLFLAMKIKTAKCRKMGRAYRLSLATKGHSSINQVRDTPRQGTTFGEDTFLY